jgi:hypothetical protein
MGRLSTKTSRDSLINWARHLASLETFHQTAVFLQGAPQTAFIKLNSAFNKNPFNSFFAILSGLHGFFFQGNGFAWRCFGNGSGGFTGFTIK